MPIDISDGTVINGITVYNHNLSPTQEKTSVRILKNYGNGGVSFTKSLLIQSYDVPSGYSSLFIPATETSSLLPKEFISLQNTTDSDQIGVCGIQVHYEIDLIFKSGFD